MTTRKGDDDDVAASTKALRKMLHAVRTKWASHSPVSPLCLADELSEGVRVSDFCVSVLHNQRSRRGVRNASSSSSVPGSSSSSSKPTSSPSSSSSSPPSPPVHACKEAEDEEVA